MVEKTNTGKIFWRCHVCNDVHYGTSPPEICPTCKARNAYIEIDPQEAMRVMVGIDRVAEVDESVQKKRWVTLAEKAGFKLNSDGELVSGLVNGEFINEKNHGLKYCPCRITEGDPIKDLGLICPCNFFAQKNWEEIGECWCGLFVKG